MIEFVPLAGQVRGILYELLDESYDEYLLDCTPRWRATFRAGWREFDNAAFDCPESVGRCVFLTCIEGKAVGLGSFDPRQRPARGIVGHNCIVPTFRGHGYGKRQLAEILRRLSDDGCRTAWLITGGHQFFAPALRMYASLGFRATEKRANPAGPFPRVVLEAPLPGNQSAASRNEGSGADPY